jgi:hypothetical protein
MPSYSVESTAAMQHGRPPGVHHPWRFRFCLILVCTRGVLDFASEDRSEGSTPGYPRPQLQRSEWITLDGVLDFAIDMRGELLDPDQVQWDRTILVPFAPETALSGIGDTSFFCATWYRRHFTIPELKPRERLILHFGAVDYAARVWVNGLEVCLHEGGYTPFSVEITAVLRAQDTQEIIVRTEDDPGSSSHIPSGIRAPPVYGKPYGWKWFRRFTSNRSDGLRALSHPCIVSWVPFNESWGVPRSARQFGAEALCSGAVSPHKNARSHAACDRQ